MEAGRDSAAKALDRWMVRATRLEIEARYWEPIEATGSLEALLADPKFESAPDRHISLFSDHSGIHARDVASRVVALLDEHNGQLFDDREATRLDFMKTLGVWLSYLHDVGMVDARPDGRKMHAQFAAQLVFRSEFDDILESIPAGGALVERLQKVFGADPATVGVRLRELLTLALCHSKSAMPTEAMADPERLKSAMTVAVLVGLETQLEAWRVSHWADASLDNPSGNELHYARAEVDPFGWLASADPAEQELRADVLDTVRVLRVADALRQRGTDLRTSAGFEVFVDDTGQAVFHLASVEGELAVQLRLDSPLSVGEANITSAMLEPSGDLRVVLHRGAFPEDARDRVASACARVIIDIALDVLDVFPLAPNALIQLERCHDDPDFALEVQQQIGAQSGLGERTVVATSMARSDAIERTRYDGATPLAWPSSRASEIWTALGRTGFRAEMADASRCFSDARIATLSRGEVVIGQGQQGTFVYIPLAPGLELRPGAGFAAQSLAPWRHLGATAVVRRGVRNSTIAATTSLEVLMIPGDVYVGEWFRPYEIGDVEAIRGLVANAGADSSQQ